MCGTDPESPNRPCCLEVVLKIRAGHAESSFALGQGTLLAFCHPDGRGVADYVWSLEEVVGLLP